MSRPALLLLPLLLLALQSALLAGASVQDPLDTRLSSVLKFRSPAAAPAEHEDPAATVLDPNLLIKPPLFPEEESWPGSCRLRSKRYVSDGLCVSLRPISEVVCAVSCVMNAWIKGGSRPLPWRCTDSGWKRQRVRLLCRDGATRFYRIRVVQSCRCVPRGARAAQQARQGNHGNQLD